MMRKMLPILALLCFGSIASAQYVPTTLATHHGGLGTFTAVQTVNISSSSSATLNLSVASTGSGNLLVVTAVSQNNGDFISSVANGGSWTVPTGAGSCQNANGSVFVSVSCAYVTSSTSGANTIAITFNASATYIVSFYEDSTTAGHTISLDTQNSTINGSSTSPLPGQGLTLTGANDAIFQIIGTNSAAVTAINGGYGNFYTASSGYAGEANIINTTVGTAPGWTTGSTQTSIVGAIAFKTN